MEKLNKAQKMVIAADLLENSNVEIADFLREEANRITESYAKAKEKAKSKVSISKAALENQLFAEQARPLFDNAEVALNTSEIAEQMGEDLSPQKVAAIMDVLIAGGFVEKVAKSTSNKNRVGYKLVVAESPLEEDAD